MDIDLRSPKESDIPLIAKLIKQLGYPNTTDFFHRKMDKLVFSNSDEVVIAEVENTIVGLAHLHTALMLHYPGRLGRVMALVVSEDLRGMGVGTELMANLEKTAKDKGCTLMEITSSAQRDDAHSFYEKLGFEEKRKRFIKKLD